MEDNGVKISYLLDSLGHTGGKLVLYNFMDQLSERGHTVYAITPERAIRWSPGFSREAIRLTKVIGRGGLASVAKKGLKKILGRLHPHISAYRQGYLWARSNEALLQNWVESDVTIATLCTTAYANFALSHRTIALYHMQHWEEVFFSDEFGRQMARLTYHLPLGLIANSTWLSETVRERTGRESKLLLPGVNSQVFSPRGNLGEKYRSPRKIRVVTYYSPVDFKGWPDGVSAMRKVFEEVGPDGVEWLVFGSQPEKAPDIPVTFTGRLFGEKLADLYSSAHVVFMPSWYESFPLPPIEAMACGTAAIVTGTGAEDYAADGVNALVRPARDPERLAEAIVELIRNPSLACHLAEAGLETARRLNWDAATDRLEEVLRFAVAGEPISRAIVDVGQWRNQGT